jgi:hypothetical protein
MNSRFASECLHESELLDDRSAASAAFDVSSERVSVIGVFYGGQDYETALNPPDSDPDITL